MTRDRNPALTYLVREIRREQRSLDDALRSGATTPETHAIAMDQLRFVLARIAVARLIG